MNESIEVLNAARDERLALLAEALLKAAGDDRLTLLAEVKILRERVAAVRAVLDKSNNAALVFADDIRDALDGAA